MMGILSRIGGSSKEEETTTEERIRVKATRLGELRKQVDQTLATWEKKMGEAIPKDLGIESRLKLKGAHGREVLTWSNAEGVHLDGESPKTFKDKRDVVKLLPDLEDALEKQLVRLVEELEAQGQLSIMEDTGALSEAQEGELSRA